ncbi:hypothetical protein [Flavobacterium sp. ASV13]|uniref:hypothetical protein n=1 Tax=Flavobacterium sp. ASV13 TaxID=1506583 RepID=UPI000553F19B|nr:hypothetical protein [Flavobacterium sp. ASV13]
MKENPLVLKAVQYIKADYNDYEIRNFLLEEGAAEDEVEDILEEASAILKEEQVQINSKKYKVFFVLFVVLFVTSFYYFLFVLPAKIESASIIYPLLGSILICLFGILSFVYFGTWNKDTLRKIGSVHLKFDVLFFFMMLPVILMCAFLNSVFEDAANDILKKDHIEVVGTVISNTVTKKLVSGRITNIKIAVEFNTLEGEKIIADKEVSPYEFNQIYEGQEVNVVYSRTNPHNIDVLLFDDAIRKFKNSLERDIILQDLTNLIGLEKEQVGVELNKIIYGWKYDNNKKAWFNERKNIGVSVHENKVSYLSLNAQYANFLLERNGFVVINKSESGLLFKKGNLTASLQLLSTGNNEEEPFSVLIIERIKS